MKRFIILTFVLISLFAFCACGVPQEEVDAINEHLAQVQADLQKTTETLNKKIQTAESDIQKLKDRNKALEADLTEAQNELKERETALNAAQSQLEKTEKELDELKNGPTSQLAAIRTAYEKEDWQNVVALAKTLHNKFAGYDEDIEAQEMAAAAQKTLDEAAAKAAAEAAKTIEEKVHSLIRITKLSCSSPNSAGGVGIDLLFKNMHPEKTIKYLEVTVKPKNAVGDTQYCEIRNYAYYTCEATGPYAPGKGLSASDNWWWPNAWYNSTIKTIELTGITIEYTDGTWTKLKSEELPYAIW